jgi:hypothetical protein
MDFLFLIFPLIPKFKHPSAPQLTHFISFAFTIFIYISIYRYPFFPFILSLTNYIATYIGSFLSIPTFPILIFNYFLCFHILTILSSTLSSSPPFQFYFCYFHKWYFLIYFFFICPCLYVNLIYKTNC